MIGNFFHLYGLIIGIGGLVAWEMTKRVAKQRNIPQKVVERLAWWAVAGGMVGARMYHVIDKWGDYYRFSPIKVVYLWQGGLAIWGAIVGGMLGVLGGWWWGKWDGKKIGLMNLLDVLVVGLPLAQAMGRIGNWTNNELWGKNGLPLFAIEASLNLILFGGLVGLSRKNRPGQTLAGYLAGYGLIRIMLENFRPNEIIWRFYGMPVATIFSSLAILVGVIWWFVAQKQI